MDVKVFLKSCKQTPVNKTRKEYTPWGYLTVIEFLYRYCDFLDSDIQTEADEMFDWYLDNRLIWE